MKHVLACQGAVVIARLLEVKRSEWPGILCIQFNPGYDSAYVLTRTDSGMDVGLGVSRRKSRGVNHFTEGLPVLKRILYPTFFLTFSGHDKSKLLPVQMSREAKQNENYLDAFSVIIKKVV